MTIVITEDFGQTSDAAAIISDDAVRQIIQYGIGANSDPAPSDGADHRRPARGLIEAMLADSTASVSEAMKAAARIPHDGAMAWLDTQNAIEAAIPASAVLRVSSMVAEMTRGRIPRHVVELLTEAMTHRSDIKFSTVAIDLIAYHELDPVSVIALGCCFVSAGFWNTFKMMPSDDVSVSIKLRQSTSGLVLEVADRGITVMPTLIMTAALPDTIVRSMSGEPLTRYVSHPVLDAHALTIGKAEVDPAKTMTGIHPVAMPTTSMSTLIGLMRERMDVTEESKL